MSDFDGMRAEVSGDQVTAERTTREAQVTCTLDFGDWREPRLSTGLAFFDHMLEMLGWYGGFTVDATYEHRTYRLTHVICEDTGWVIGAALREVVRSRIVAGVRSNGSAFGVMDEAAALSQVSFEGRANHLISRADAAADARVEDMLAADLAAFIEGFAQGSRATVHLSLWNGVDPHHAWEAGFRAFASALRQALSPDPWRAGRTGGVKGTLD
jgi:imidazoleglycerol phosphate dehydratase HisB